MRRMQMKLLEAGNATMGVWLGKQYLGQTDQLEHRGEISLSAVLNLPRGPIPIAAPGLVWLARSVWLFHLSAPWALAGPNKPVSNAITLLTSTGIPGEEPIVFTSR